MIFTEKTYSYFSYDLNTVKYKEIILKAKQLRSYKNDIINSVFSDFLYFIDKSKFDWINHFRTRLPNCNNQDISNAIEDCYVACDNKRKQFTKKTSIYLQKSITYTYYKRNTKNNKVGDLKSTKFNKKHTTLTKVTSFLAKYYNDDILEYLVNTSHSDANKEAFRLSIIHYLTTYEHSDRLIKLVKSIQTRLIQTVASKPIVFESLTFRSCTEQKGNIIIKNPNKNSIYNALIVLSGQKINGGKIVIPTRHSGKYHGKIKHYFKEPDSKNRCRTSYTIVIDEHKKRLKINLTRKKHSDVVTGKDNYYGVDVNVKHNLFADKIGNFIDYDRNLFNKHVELLLKQDNKKKRLGVKTLSKKDGLTLTKSLLRVNNMIKSKCNELVKQAISLGKDHIVMEDLEHMGRSFARNDEFNGVKYSRIVASLHLPNIKNIIASIANKKGLQVTFIQPHYTSQTCECGCIGRGNRVIQEEFKCVSCGLTHNADTHSAKMIEDRLSVDVLRQALLVYKKGFYSPKVLTKESIKSILVDCYDNMV